MKIVLPLAITIFKCTSPPTPIQHTVFTAKKGKTVTPSRRLEAKGEMRTLQTVKLSQVV